MIPATALLFILSNVSSLFDYIAVGEIYIDCLSVQVYTVEVLGSDAEQVRHADRHARYFFCNILLKVCILCKHFFLVRAC